MKKFIATILIALTLVGCSSFKLGGMVYCPNNTDCQFEQTVPKK